MNKMLLVGRRDRSRRWQLPGLPAAGANQRNRHRHHRSPPPARRPHSAFPSATRSNSCRRKSAACRSRSSCSTTAAIRPLPPPMPAALSRNPRPTSSWARRPRRRRIAVSNVANEAGIPHFGLAPFPITPERAKWSVVMPQPVPIMGKVLYEHMKAHNIKTVGYIGYSDSYGDLWFNDFNNQARADGHDAGRRRTLRPAGYVGRRPGAEAGCRQSRCDPGRRLRHRGRPAADRACASAATRA